MSLRVTSRDLRRRRGSLAVLAGLVLVAFVIGCGPATEAQAARAPIYGYHVVHSYPHDSTAFTQGLLYRDGFLYESTGLNGQSTLRKVALETGQVVQRHVVNPQFFAEGLVDWKDELIQLTWRSQVGFIYGLDTFAEKRTFTYRGEGWGLTRDDARLIMSDGSAELRFLDPSTFRELSRVSVTDVGRPVLELNELEYVRGEIYANVWQTDRIARIDPATGRVTGWIDLAGLLPAGARRSPDAVLNGIAWDAKGNRLFVTGKLWPMLYEITVGERR
jgi:glutaminyl-peptide cyclotransferase